jgi:peptide/nickel transport system substrate-binding protein
VNRVKVVDRAVVLGGLAVLTILGATLAGTPTGLPVSSAQPAGERPAQQRVLREGVMGQVRTLDPLFTTTQPERDIDALLFRGLTRLGADGTIVPDLASNWGVGQNGRVYTFVLRDDARWHDGVAVTADDVVFTIRTLQHPRYMGAAGAAWRGITVERVDRMTVRFRLPAAPGGFLLLAEQPIVPSHLLSGTPIDQLSASGFGQQPVGSGPYRLESLGPAGAELVAVSPTDEGTPAPANPLAGAAPSPANNPPRPAIARYRFRFFTDSTSLASAFRAREIDAVGGLTLETISSLVGDPGVTVIAYPRTVLTTVLLNLRAQLTTAFRDARVRRAMLMALDRKRMVDELLHGLGRLANTPISPASFAYDRKAAGSVPYDPDGAAKLLRAAGWKKVTTGWLRPKTKRPLEFELSAFEPTANRLAYAVAQHVATDWAALGIKVTLKTYSSEDLVQKQLLPGRYLSSVVDVNLGLDPDLFPLLASAQALAGGTNLSGYQSRQLDTLLQSARVYASGARRKARFAALQQRLTAELPILPLFFTDYVFVVRSTLVGPTPREIASPQDRYWDVLTWRLADGPSG